MDQVPKGRTFGWIRALAAFFISMVMACVFVRSQLKTDWLAVRLGNHAIGVFSSAGWLCVSETSPAGYDAFIMSREKRVTGGSSDWLQRDADLVSYNGWYCLGLVEHTAQLPTAARIGTEWRIAAVTAPARTLYIPDILILAASGTYLVVCIWRLARWRRIRSASSHPAGRRGT
jgi:hypothetical protein